MFKATAGLRAIQDENAKDAVMNAVRNVLSSSSFKFEPSWARIIPGNEEAGLAWVSANYLSGVLEMSHRATTTGVIEMGGGSTQVTFEIGSNLLSTLSEDEKFAFVDLKGRRYNLYAHSYLGFGQDYAMTTFYKRLSANTQNDPCCYPGRICGQEKAIFGSGDYLQCVDEVKELVFGDSQAPPSQTQPDLQGPFYATENFFYVRDDVSTYSGMDREKTMMIQNVNLVGSNICSNKNIQDEDGKYCFALAYQNVFLEKIGGLKLRNPPKVTRTVNGGEVDWALGAAVVHVCHHYMPSGGGWMQHSAFSSTIDNVPASWFLLLLLVLLVMLTWRKKNGGDNKFLD